MRKVLPAISCLKCAPLGGDLCKLGLWRAAAARLNCVQEEEEEEEETKPNKFHLVVQNFGARASSAAAAAGADLHP